ncbi:MAG TPA: S1 RNA-binding domain-containing protein [Polyangiaceae bacterium]|nr:S1 RNA-binding domain-containing protein [Polyangiaceae bacterium]
MNSKDSFASLLAEGATQAAVRQGKRLKPGDVVKGTVIQIGHDTVFLDIGGSMDARMDRSEFLAKDGTLSIAVGDSVRATVVGDGEYGPRLARSFGKGAVDVSQLQQALDSALPVEGKVTRATKGGLELTLGGVRAFCPASQIDLGFVQDLEPFVGQTLEFRVMEIKEDGRSIVASRKALLQAQATAEQSTLLARLVVGEVMEGTVASIQKFGAFIDLGGIQGLVHISEIAPHRIERVEDMLDVGERVQVRVQKIERSDKGQPRIELSMKALAKPAERSTVKKDTVLEATVVKSLPNGILVETSEGSGLVPARELGIPRGADHRRAFPVGSALRVVVMTKDPTGRLSFSAAKVGAAEERQNFADYGKADASSASLGSFGEILRAKLGLPQPPPAPAPATPKPAPAASVAAQPTKLAAPAVDPNAPTAASRVFVDPTPAPVKKGPKPHTGDLPTGVVRRKPTS